MPRLFCARLALCCILIWTISTDVSTTNVNAFATSSKKKRLKSPGANSPDCHAIQDSVSHGILIAQSEDKGLGAFSTKPILKGEWIGDYEGEHMTEKQIRARFWDLEKPTKEDRRWKRSRKRRGQGMSGDYIFDLGDEIYIDAEDSDNSGWCRYMNHAADTSDECNVRTHHDDGGRVWSDGETSVMPKLWFTALRNIEPGEELLYDYGDDYWIGDKEDY